MASQKFQATNILFVDCPVSGGPARALTGELTMMASGDNESLEAAQPILDALGKDVHIISGGPGAGSTVKCVHQLLAGVHICAAAEAMGMYCFAGMTIPSTKRGCDVSHTVVLIHSSRCEFLSIT
jgi:L-threonate 2-dehydrogenase